MKRLRKTVYKCVYCNCYVKYEAEYNEQGENIGGHFVCNNRKCEAYKKETVNVEVGEE